MRDYCGIKKITVSTALILVMILNITVTAAVRTNEFVSNVYLKDDYLTVSGRSAFDNEKINVFLLNEGKTVADLNAADTTEKFGEAVNYCNVIQSDSNGNFAEKFKINGMKQGKRYLLYVQGNAQSYTQYIEQKQYIYVSKNGSDSKGNGSAEKPFATITGARDYLRGKSRTAPVEVIIGKGTYRVSKTIDFNSRDSGTEDFPITYKAEEAGKVIFKGTSSIDVSKLTAVTDEGIRARLQSGIADKLVQIDLAEQGIPKKVVDFLANYTPGVSGKAMGVYLNDKPQSISRWPNTGYEKIEKVVNAGGSASDGTTGGGIFKISGLDENRAARWAAASDMYIEGYLGNDWHGEWAKVGSVNSDNLTVELDTYTHYGIAENMRVAAVNLPEEIDVPGEWYADADSMKLYYYPPHTLTSEDKLEIATLCGNFITVDNASYINFEGMEFAKNADSPDYEQTNANGGHGIALFSGASDINISNCILRDIGMDGIITYAKNVDITGCIIYNTGWSGITVSCGSRNTLASGNVRISDCVITGINRDTGSNHIAGITISGVGAVVENNILFNIPNSAVRYSGNNHVIRNNEIYNCVNKTADAGAIYAGNSWTSYGTNIINNYFHDIGGGIDTSFQASAVFWDDNHSGNNFIGNIVNINNRVETLGVKIGGGRDNTVAANIIVNSAGGIGGEDRTVNPPMIYDRNDENNFYNRTLFQTFKEAANNVANAYDITDGDWIAEYKSSYPEIMDNFNQLKSRYYKRTEIIKSNVMYNCDTAIGIAEKMANDSTVSDNVTVSQGDFADAANGDYRIKNSSKASLGLAAEVPDESFDMDTIGLRSDSSLISGISEFDPVYPETGSNISGTQTVLKWNPTPLADSYIYEVASDRDFNNIAVSGTTAYNIAEISGLENNKEYFWRVTAVNKSRQLGGRYVCGNVFRFTTSGELLFKNIVYNRTVNTIKFSAVNTKTTPESFVAIAALKDSAGKLVAIRSSGTVSLSANTSKSYTLRTAFEEPEADKAEIIEFYVWNSLSEMRNLAEKERFNK